MLHCWGCLPFVSCSVCSFPIKNCIVGDRWGARRLGQYMQSWQWRSGNIPVISGSYEHCKSFYCTSCTKYKLPLQRESLHVSFPYINILMNALINLGCLFNIKLHESTAFVFVVLLCHYSGSIMNRSTAILKPSVFWLVLFWWHHLQAKICSLLLVEKTWHLLCTSFALGF